MSFVVLNCQVVECVDIFANPVFKNPGILIPIPIPIAIHQQGLSCNIVHYLKQWDKPIVPIVKERRSLRMKRTT